MRKSTETLLVNAGLAAGALFVWSRRDQILSKITGQPAPAGGGGGSIFGPGGTSNPTAVQPLVQVQPTLTVQPAPIQTAGGTVYPSQNNQTYVGCVYGPSGGIYCPDTPGAVVIAAQTDACLPPSSLEIDACNRRKPTWTRAQCTERLTLLRKYYCEQRPYANQGQPWTTNLANFKTDYFNLTNVTLT